MQNKNLPNKKELCFSFKSFADSHYVFASTASGGLLRKPMNQSLIGLVEISQNPCLKPLKLNISSDRARRTAKS